MRGKVEIGINEDKLLLCLQTSSMCNIILSPAGYTCWT